MFECAYIHTLTKLTSREGEGGLMVEEMGISAEGIYGTAGEGEAVARFEEGGRGVKEGGYNWAYAAISATFGE